MKMKAVVYNEYGAPEVLKIQEVEKPIPNDNQILIKIHATSVNFGDLMARNFGAISPKEFNMPYLFWLMTLLSFGRKKPKIKVLGNEFSGVVEVVGKKVKRWKAGDQVFGYLGASFGAYAEYVCMPEHGCLAILPANMTLEEAGSAPYGAIMALPLLKKANLQPGQKVLILGASGSIGSAAVQIAKHFGAEVTGVCGTPRLGFIKALGADRVIDYTKEDFTQNGETYDLILDVLGKSSVEACKNSLKQGGIHLFASFKMKQLMQTMGSKKDGKRVICSISPGSREDLNSVRELIEQGAFKVIIDKCFPLEQTYEAHRYVEQGNKKGNIVITVE